MENMSGASAERCEVTWCGFEWEAVDPEQIAARILDAAGVAADLVARSSGADRRSQPQVWSPLEYAGHLRDVLFNIRDRLVVAINEENPSTKGLYGPERVELGLYRGDPAEVVADELLVAAALFARTWTRIPAELRERTMIYRYPQEAARSLSWVAAQALHECEHHLADIRSGLAA